MSFVDSIIYCQTNPCPGLGMSLTFDFPEWQVSVQPVNYEHNQPCKPDNTSWAHDLEVTSYIIAGNECHSCSSEVS
jgi:hypothetical protein